MKNLFILLVFLGISSSVFSQCDIHPFIEDNYTIDASILALREILSDPADPDYDNPFVPAERIEPYLEKLSAIYENPQNNPRIDSLFNEFQFHVNPVYNIHTEYKVLGFLVPTSTSWVQPLKSTGVSGYQELDDFFSLYQLTVSNFIDLTSSGNTIFYMETSYDFLNIKALLDNMLAFEDITSAEVASSGNPFNYTGVPYFIPGPAGGGNAEVCDIIYNDNLFSFYLGADDCFAGCQAEESRYVSVSKDCQEIAFLNTPEFSLSKVVLHPNPATNFIQVTSKNVRIDAYKIYSLDGKKQVSRPFQDTIDVSQLHSGMYFITFTSDEGITHTEKFIKK